MLKETCKCGKIKEHRSLSECKSCHNEYRRKWRKEHPFTEEQKERAKKTRRLRNELRLHGKRKRRPRLGAKPGVLRPLCSWCDAVIENFKKKNYCKKCAAKYNREWRKKNPPTEEQRLKDIVRVKTYDRIKKGLLIRQPCEMCGEIKVEAHHDDYNKPFEVRWLCVKHHHEFHGRQRRLLNATGSENN